MSLPPTIGYQRGQLPRQVNREPGLQPHSFQELPGPRRPSVRRNIPPDHPLWHPVQHSQHLTPFDVGAATNSLRFVPRRPAPDETFFFNIAFMYLVFRYRRLVRLTPEEGVSSGRNPDSFNILQPLAAAGPLLPLCLLPPPHLHWRGPSVSAPQVPYYHPESTMPLADYADNVFLRLASRPYLVPAFAGMDDADCIVLFEDLPDGSTFIWTRVDHRGPRDIDLRTELATYHEALRLALWHWRGSVNAGGGTPARALEVLWALIDLESFLAALARMGIPVYLGPFFGRRQKRFFRHAFPLTPANSIDDTLFDIEPTSNPIWLARALPDSVPLRYLSHEQWVDLRVFFPDNALNRLGNPIAVTDDPLYCPMGLGLWEAVDLVASSEVLPLRVASTDPARDALEEVDLGEFLSFEQSQAFARDVGVDENMVFPLGQFDAWAPLGSPPPPSPSPSPTPPPSPPRLPTPRPISPPVDAYPDPESDTEELQARRSRRKGKGRVVVESTDDEVADDGRLEADGVFIPGVPSDEEDEISWGTPSRSGSPPPPIVSIGDEDVEMGEVTSEPSVEEVDAPPRRPTARRALRNPLPVPQSNHLERMRPAQHRSWPVERWRPVGAVLRIVFPGCERCVAAGGACVIWQFAGAASTAPPNKGRSCCDRCHSDHKTCTPVATLRSQFVGDIPFARNPLEYWEHVGNGDFVRVVRDRRLQDLPVVAAVHNWTQFCYRFLPTQNTARSQRRTAEGRPAPHPPLGTPTEPRADRVRRAAEPTPPPATPRRNPARRRRRSPPSRGHKRGPPSRSPSPPARRRRDSGFHPELNITINDFEVDDDMPPPRPSSPVAGPSSSAAPASSQVASAVEETVQDMFALFGRVSETQSFEDFLESVRAEASKRWEEGKDRSFKGKRFHREK
ncbi:hypothetical protein FB45DRAFT_1048159 [Roridomyces roridus]|uniref:Uncharacterized protein n=1 Tax=Roridomyces roridus TaxID=1738132 RepID=A0AAD7F5C6_9AGAR|nr:hypothetical protein FB45DRAFT_1048159 [Roridomyces roridus]